VTANDATTLTVTPTWDIEPDATSVFVVAEASWRFGALTLHGPAEFDIPNRTGAMVHVSGRSANVHDQESSAELSIVTRWRIGGAGITVTDDDLPPPPIFGLIPVGRGMVELAGVGFEDLTNTRTATAGTLTLFYWDELTGTPSLQLVSDIDEQTTLLAVGDTAQVRVGDLLQIDAEVITVTDVLVDAVVVVRGAYACVPESHQSGAPIYSMSDKRYVVPFVRDFFGSPASGSYSFPIFLPDVRVAAAELFLTNMRGDGPARRISFMTLSNAGIRTLSGGQFSLQFDGVLALQMDATPLLMVDESHAVRDVYAQLREPAAGDVRVRVRQDSAVYCDLTIPAGATRAMVNGFGLPPLLAQSQLSLDVIGVPQAPDAFPGGDLTVTLRM
jgi:hypothetical protein